MSEGTIHIQFPESNRAYVEKAFEGFDVTHSHGPFGGVSNITASDGALAVARDLLEKGIVNSVEDSRDRPDADTSASAETPLEISSVDGPV